VSFEPEFLELMDRAVIVEPFVKTNSAGKPSYGTPVSCACYIRDDVKIWKWEDGTESQSRRVIYVNYPVGNSDRLTLPSGYEPNKVVPLWVVRHDDDEGFHHTKVYC